ncbi:hypothetical protein LTR56_008347 [Elasticomyces elasticus]|nr:hypothetical protein LTR56_008347 [Elasticomyces elasticus]KAK3661483.1 hypothetical protein LTR22_007493 [Elasticomyces elasticus]KAK5756904.1 hypothetical protein LTS12_012983 [Elasticomyces elasticus]
MRRYRLGFFGSSGRSVQDNLKLLEQKEIYVIGDKLDALQQVTEELAHDADSKYTHTGAGHLFAYEGGNPETYVFSGSGGRQIIKPGSYHEGPTNKGELLERAETPPEPTSNVPFRRDPDFIERGDLLDQIHAKISQPAARVALPSKSQLAIEHCYRLRGQSRETWVLWIHASSAARFGQGVREIADLAKIRGRDDPKSNIFELVRGWLRDAKKGKWVLVLDNVDDAGFLLKHGHGGEGTQGRRSSGDTLLGYIPVCDHGSILITTRSEEVARRLVEYRDVISIGTMKDGHALRLLQKKLGDREDVMDAPDLAKELENMPLALTQAAAYLGQMGGRCSVRKYIDKLRQSDKSKESILDEDAGDLRRDREAWNSYSAVCGQLLSLMSFCDRQAIPEALVRWRNRKDDESAQKTNRGYDHNNLGGGSSDSDDSDNVSATEDEEGDLDDAFNKDIRMLEGYSFVSVTTDASVWEMHRLVQVATRKWLKSQGQLEQWGDQYIEHLCALVPLGTYENWMACRNYYPHAQSVAELKPRRLEALL